MSRPLRSTGDLVVVVLWTLLAAGMSLFGAGPEWLRAVLALPLVVAFPGYALLAFLFPESPENRSAPASITGVERAGLSVVASLAVVPLLAFVVNYTSYGLRLRPLLAAVGGTTLVLALLGWAARVRLPVERRYGVSPRRWLADGTRYLSLEHRSLREMRPLQPETEGQRLLNLVLVVSVVTLATTAGYAAVTPPANDDPFSEFYLLTHNDGGYVAEDLPHEFTRGEGRTVFVAIGNHEGQRVPYTVVVQLDGREVDRFSTSVDRGETKRIERSVTPTKTGDRLKLSFLLYRGEVPAQPTPENAYRETHLWISVSG